MKETEELLSLGDASMTIFTSSPFLIHCLTLSIIEGNMAWAWAWLCVLMRASMSAVATAVAVAVAAIIFCSLVTCWLSFFAIAARGLRHNDAPIWLHIRHRSHGHPPADATGPC